MKDYLEQLESALSDMTSVDELETFDRDLNAAMRDYGVTNVMVDYYIDRRRDELLERESDKKTAPVWSPSASPEDMSDNEIRSLFGALTEQ